MSSSYRESVINGKAISPETAADNPYNPYDLLDESWVRTSFMITDAELSNPYDKANRYWSTASAKFTDSRIGGNFGINNPPQYTPYCDFPIPGRLAGRQIPSPYDTSGNYGWGPYYSEAVDDTKQMIYMRFGVPQFNSLLNYFLRAFDPAQSTLARTGRMPSAFYTASKYIGTYLAVTTAPAIAITVLAGRVVSFFFNRSTSKFYTMRPTMHLYWSTVNTLVNTLAINLGIFPKITNMNKDDTQKLGRPFTIDQAYLSSLSKIIPDVFGEENYFDIHSIANRAQRLANQIHTQEFNSLDAGSPTDFTGTLMREMSGDGTRSHKVMDKAGNFKLSDLIDETLKLSNLFKAESTDSQVTSMDPRIDPATGQQTQPSWLEDYAKYFDAEFRMGSQFATFNVDYTGPVTTSFSNQTGQSQLAQKLNSTSATVREARFALAEGNIIGGLVKDIQDSLMDAASGLLAGVTMDMGAFLKGIMGDGFVDIPDHWMNSGVQLPETTYTMTLMATYNTPMSRMLNLYIPLCMIMAGALPRSIGKQAYTAPFLCQIFDKGRAQIRLGMIKSLSITAGAGSNIGFDSRGNPLAFEVSFTVADLSSVMHMPVSSGTFGDVDITMDEDNILSDYLATLASQDIYTQIYPMAAARLRLAKLAMNVGKWTSPAFWASATYNSSTQGVMQYLTLGAGNVLEAVVRGAETSYGRQ
jgi:hypothetical protein